MTDLPRPVTNSDSYLAALHGLMAQQNELLGEIRDRLGQANNETPPAGGDGPQPVELAEPDPPPRKAATRKRTHPSRS